MNRLSVKPLVKITAMKMRVRIANMLVRGIMARNRYQLKPRRGIVRPAQVHGTAARGRGETFTKEIKEPYIDV